MKLLKTNNNKYISILIHSGSGDQYFVLSMEKLTSKMIKKIEKVRREEEAEHHFLDDLIDAHPEWDLEVIDFDSYGGVHGID